MDVKKFRNKYHLSNSDIVRVIKYKYPLFCKYSMTMVSNPRYGVQLTPGAEETLLNAVNRKKPNRRKNHQLTVRVDDDLFYAISFACGELGVTVQELLESAVFRYLSVRGGE